MKIARTTRTCLAHWHVSQHTIHPHGDSGARRPPTKIRRPYTPQSRKVPARIAFGARRVSFDPNPCARKFLLSHAHLGRSSLELVDETGPPPHRDRLVGLGGRGARMAVLPQTHDCRGQGSRPHEKPKAWVHRCVAMDAEVAAVFAHMSQPVIIFGSGLEGVTVGTGTVLTTRRSPSIYLGRWRCRVSKKSGL